MNLIDIIENNKFLKQLYPNGIFNFFVGQCNLDFNDRMRLVLHVRDSPNLEVKKWGKWNENYNIITLELTGALIKGLNVDNWQNNILQKCDFYFKDLGKGTSMLKFYGENWSLEIKLGSLIYQRSSTYIID